MRLKKLIAAGFITAVLTLAMSVNAFAFGWQQSGPRWWFGTNWNNTTWFANGWQMIDGYWYYFDADGWMAQNQWIGDYYVGHTGAMLTNTYTPDGYWVGEDGKWVRNGGSGSSSSTSETKWTGEYHILNAKTQVWGNQFYGHDSISASGTKIKIKGYFRKGDNSSYMGYHEKTFKVDSDTQFYGAGDDDTIELEKADFFKRLNKNSGMDLTLILDDDYVVEATLTS